MRKTTITVAAALSMIAVAQVHAETISVDFSKIATDVTGATPIEACNGLFAFVGNNSSATLTSSGFYTGGSSSSTTRHIVVKTTKAGTLTVQGNSSGDNTDRYIFVAAEAGADETKAISESAKVAIPKKGVNQSFSVALEANKTYYVCIHGNGTINKLSFAVAGTFAPTGDRTRTVDITVAKGKESNTGKITLQPGTYELTDNNDKLYVSTTIDKENYSEGKLFTLTKATEVTFTAKYKDGKADNDYKTTVTVTLTSGDAQKVKDYYTNKLTVQINKCGVYTNDKTLQELARKAAELQAEINKIGITEYDEYVKTGKVELAEKAISELGDKIDAAAKNYTQYAHAQEAYGQKYSQEDNAWVPVVPADGLLASKAKLEETFEGIDSEWYLGDVVSQKEATDEQIAENAAIQKAVKEAYQSQYEAAIKSVADFIADADAKYAAGTCASLTDDVIKASKNAITDNIKKLIKGIESGNTSIAEYLRVNAAVGKSRVVYSTVASDLYTDLIDNPKYKTVEKGETYSDVYAEALTELNKQQRIIKSVEDENSDKITRTEADALIKKLEAAKAAMNQVATDVMAKVDLLRANYAAALKDVADNIEQGIKDMKSSYDKLKDTKAFYEPKVKELENELATGIKANVEAANKNHTIKGEVPFYPNYKNDKDAFNEKVKALRNQVDAAVAEENAHNATVAAIADKQKELDAAKKEVAGLKAEINELNEDGTPKKKDGKNVMKTVYTIGDRFDATVKAIQDSIDALTAGDAENYTVPTNGAWDGKDAIKVAQEYKAGISTKTSKIHSDVLDYDTKSGDLIDKATEIYTALEKYNNRLAALKKQVGEFGDVTVTGKLKNADGEPESYTEAMAAQQKLIEEITKALKAAEALNDVPQKDEKEVKHTHYSDMMALETNPEIEAKIAELSGNFNDKKEAWDQANLNMAASNLLEQAENILTYNLIIDKDKESYDKETYGKNADNDWKEKDKEGKDVTVKSLNSQLKGIKAKNEAAKNEVADKKAAIEAVGGKATAEDVAKLAEIVKLAESIEKEFKTLTELAEKVKAAYAAEKAKYAALNSHVDGIPYLDVVINGGTLDEVVYSAEKLNGNLNGIVKGTWNELKRGDIVGLKTKNDAALTSLKTLEGEIAASFEAETLVADSEDVKGKDGKVTPGYTTRLAELANTVADLLQKAKNEKANLDAKNEIDKHVAVNAVEIEGEKETVEKAIEAAEIDIEALGLHEKGKTYFAGVIDNYTTTLNGDEKGCIKYDTNAAYETNLLDKDKKDQGITDPSKNAAGMQASLQDRINKLYDEVKGIVAQADANEKAYWGTGLDGKTDGLLKVYTDAKAKLEKLSNEIGSRESSSIEGEWSTKLTEFRKTIEGYHTAIDEAYANGTSDKVVANLAQVNAEMDNALAQFLSEYNAAIVKDNADRKLRYDKAQTGLEQAYAKAIDNITKLSRLTYAQGKEGILAEVTGPDGIYKYADVIRSLKAKVNEGYADTLNININKTAEEEAIAWDIDENNRLVEVAELQQKIMDLSNDYTNAVNAEAVKMFSGEKGVYTNANGQYTTAKNRIADETYWNKIKRVPETKDPEVLGDVKSLLDKYNGAAKTDDKGNFVNQNFAYILDTEIIPALEAEKIKAMIDADLQTASEIQWTGILNDARTLAASEQPQIDEFMSLDTDEDGNFVKGKFSDEYQTLFNNTLATILDKQESEERILISIDTYPTLRGMLDDAMLGGFNIENLEDVVVGKDSKGKDIVEKHTSIYKSAFDEDQNFQKNDVAYNEHVAVISGLNDNLEAAIAFANSLVSRDNSVVLGAIKGVEESLSYYLWYVDYCHTLGISQDENKDAEWAKARQKQTEENIANIYNLSLTEEYNSFAPIINDLQYNWDKASAALISDPNADEQLAAWKAAIMEVESSKEDINDLYVNGTETEEGVVKATKEETQAAYIALEKKAGELMTAMAKTYESGIVEETLAEVKTNNVDVVAQKINSITDGIHQSVIEKNKEAIESLQSAIASLQGDVDAAVSEQTLLIKKANFIAESNDLDAKYGVLKKKIDGEEMPLDISDAKWAELDAELNELTAAVDKLNERFAAEGVNQRTDGKWYIDEVEYTNYREYRVALMKNYIAEDRNVIGDNPEAMTPDHSLTEYSYNYNADRVRSRINNTEINLAKYDANQDENNVWSAYNTALSNLDEDLLSQENLDKLNSELAVVYNAAGNLSNYNTQGQLGKVDHDIDGNEILDEEGKPTTKKVDFLTDGIYSEVKAKAKEIMQTIAGIEAEIVEVSYKKGDVNRDGVVDMLDYAKLASIILNGEQGDNELIAKLADVDGDGEVDVVDLSQLVLNIQGNYKSSSKAAAFLAKQAAAEANDRLTVELENNVLAIGVQNKIAYTALQMDITLPSGASVNSEALTERANGHELLIKNIKGNTYRVLVITSENSAFSGNDGALFTLDLLNMHGTAAIDNIVFTDAKANKYRFTVGNNATAIQGVEAQQSMTEKIFSIGGQMMNSMRNGVNIIKSANGSIKKIMNK